MSRKSRVKPYEIVPFTNDIDQVIQPGEAIVAITKSAGSVGTYVGKYLGLRKYKPRWADEETVNVVIETVHEIENWLHNETNEEWSYKTSIPGIELPKPPSYNLENYGYKGPSRYWHTSKTVEEQKQLNEAYEKQHAAHRKYAELLKFYYEEREKYKVMHYHKVITTFTKKRTLYLNMIYAIQTRLADVF